MIGFSPTSEPLYVLAAQIPDAPTHLSNIAFITMADRVGLAWLPPQFDGGSEIFDYAVWYDNGTDGAEWFEIESGLTTTMYTVMNLVQGTVYKFKVVARNDYGYGAYSDILTELAA